MLVPVLASAVHAAASWHLCCCSALAACTDSITTKLASIPSVSHAHAHALCLPGCLHSVSAPLGPQAFVIFSWFWFCLQSADVLAQTGADYWLEVLCAHFLA
jgi:hypothetical protein